MLAPDSPAFHCLIPRSDPACLRPSCLTDLLEITSAFCPWLWSSPLTVCSLGYLVIAWFSSTEWVLLPSPLWLPAVLWLGLFLHWVSTRLSFTDITHQCPGLVWLNQSPIPRLFLPTAIVSCTCANKVFYQQYKTVLSWEFLPWNETVHI